MILLIDPVCRGNTHEIVNAGMVKLVDAAFDEEVCYLAERSNVNNIKSLLTNCRIVYASISDHENERDPDDLNNLIYYVMLLERYIVKYRPSRCFVLCAYRPCIEAVLLLAQLHKKTYIYIVLHSMIESGFGKQADYYRLLHESQRRKNIKFISYSPFCSDDYWNLEKDKLLFVHHPFLDCQKKDVRLRQDKPIVIGVIGACANNRARYIIKKISELCRGREYLFWVASRFSKEFGGLSNTEIVREPFDRNDMKKRLADTDYLLLPYGKDDYQISASGVLWDGITNDVPCLMLSSPYFTAYKQYDIGIQFETIEMMIEGIKSIIMSCTRKKHKMNIGGLMAVNIKSLRKTFL